MLSFSSWLEEMAEQETQQQVEEGYFSKEGEPLKCTSCNSKDLGHKNCDFLDNTLCEYDIVCNSCKSILAHWAFGYWVL